MADLSSMFGSNSSGLAAQYENYNPTAGYNKASSFQNQGGGLEFMHGMQNFLPSLGMDFQNFRPWEGGAAADNAEIGGGGGFNDSAVWNQLAPMLDQQGYSFGFNPTGGGGSMMNVMQNGNNVGQFRAREDQNWIDKYGPILPLLAAGGIGAFNAMGAGAGAAQGAAASAVPEAAASNALELGLSSTPMATPAGGVSSLSEALMSAGMPQATAAPGMGIAAEAGLGAGALGGATALAEAAPEASAMGASSADKAAMFGDAGYGSGMSGAATSAFDTILGLTGSMDLANIGGTAVNMGSQMTNSPMWDEFRKLYKSPMGRAVRGLGALYQGTRNNKDISGQIKGLQGLYGPNSAYAKQLQQSLERRDAAAGRRSQYGPRSVELQAKLADSASRQAPTLANLYNQKMQNRGQMINTALNFPKLEELFGG